MALNVKTGVAGLGKASNSGKRVWDVYQYTQLWAAVTGVECIALGEVCKRTVDRAGG